MSQCVVDGCGREAYGESDKCIFHCEKIESYWDNVESEQTKEFWTEIKMLGLENAFENFSFPIFEEFGWSAFAEKQTIQAPLKFLCCKFKNLDFQSKKFKIILFLNCNIEKQVEFYDCKFESEAIFSGCKFNEEVEFIKCTFYVFKLEDVSFSEILFREIVVCASLEIKHMELANVGFNDFTIKNDAKIFLDNILFYDAFFGKVNWGDISQKRFFKNLEKPLDREIARQIKYTYDQQGDHIVANKFYSLEMALHRDELRKNGSWQDRLTFGLHGMVSSHGRSWALPLYWLFVVGFVFAGLAAFDKDSLWGFGFLALLSVFSLFFYDIKDKRGLAILTFVGSFGFYFIAMRETCLPVNLDYFIAMINPLEGFKNNYEIPTTLGFTCKLVVLYISYQFITAVRKDTRR